MEQDPIISKIIKLLEMADPSRGATESERKTATKMAFKLMTEHGIDKAKVDKQRNAEYQGISHRIVIMHRVQRHDFDLNIAHILINCFHAKVIFSQRFSTKLNKLSFCYIIIGDELQLALCELAIPIFVKVMRGGISRILKERGTKWTADVGRAYYDGVTVGYIEQSQEGKAAAIAAAKRENADAFAIVLVDRADAIVKYAEKEFPSKDVAVRNYKASDIAAFARGVEDGKKVVISDSQSKLC